MDGQTDEHTKRQADGEMDGTEYSNIPLPLSLTGDNEAT